MNPTPTHKVMLDTLSRISYLVLTNMRGAFKDVLNQHGVITKNEIGSLAKRAHSALMPQIKDALGLEIRRVRYDSFKAGYIQAMKDHNERWNVPTLNVLAKAHEESVNEETTTEHHEGGSSDRDEARHWSGWAASKQNGERGPNRPRGDGAERGIG